MKRLAVMLIAVLVRPPGGSRADTLNVAFERTMLTLDTYATPSASR